MPPATLTTDTLHLVDAPHLVGTLPLTSLPYEERVPDATQNLAGVIGQAEVLLWTMPMPNVTALTGSVVLWGKVEGTVVHQDATNPCFWQVGFRVARADGGAFLFGTDCIEEPTIVPEGTRKLEFLFEDVEMPPFAGGVSLSLVVSTTAVAQGPGAGVFVLAGTQEFDSTWTIKDLLAPVDIETLLI
jgi:hypothetical protein